MGLKPSDITVISETDYNETTKFVIQADLRVLDGKDATNHEAGDAIKKSIKSAYLDDNYIVLDPEAARFYAYTATLANAREVVSWLDSLAYAGKF